MPARVQIIVDAKDAASGILRGITGQLGAFGGLIEEITSQNVNWGNVVERATTMVIDGVKDAIKTTQEYGEAVRDQMLLSDQSAEASSRFLQVLDDYQLTADDAKLATKALTREGLAPTVETLMKLSAEYQNLNTAQERNAFVQKNLGRAGQEWLNLLNQGPDKIKAVNDAVSEGLILTEKNVAAIEEWRLNLDEFNDNVDQFKVSYGNKFIEALNNAADGMRENQRAAELLKEKGLTPLTATAQDIADAHTNARIEMSLAAEEMQKVEQAATETADKEAQLAQTADELKAAMSGDFLEAHENYDEKMSELTAEAADLNAQLEKLYKQGFKKNKDEINELNGELRENKAAQEEVAKATDKAIAKMIFQQAAAHLDAEGQLELARSLGLISEQDYAVAKAIDDLTAEYDANKDGIVSATEATDEYIRKLQLLNKNLQALPDVVTTDVVTNFSQTGTKPANYYQTPTCFIAGTFIRMADGTEKLIEDVQKGDRVASFDLAQNKAISTRVSEVFHHSPAEMSKPYYLFINDVVGVTCEHPIYANGKWTLAEQLRAGDELHGYNTPAAVLCIRRIYRRVPTYNLHIDHECHNYFADGVLVHNKQQGGVVYAGQPTPVGEGGAEMFTPSVNGRVLSHSEAIHALTVAGGGGKGNTNYFLGNVTIASGGDNPGDILEVRP